MAILRVYSFNFVFNVRIYAALYCINEQQSIKRDVASVKTMKCFSKYSVSTLSSSYALCLDQPCKLHDFTFQKASQNQSISCICQMFLHFFADSSTRPALISVQDVSREGGGGWVTGGGGGGWVTGAGGGGGWVTGAGGGGNCDTSAGGGDWITGGGDMVTGEDGGGDWDTGAGGGGDWATGAGGGGDWVTGADGGGDCDTGAGGGLTGGDLGGGGEVGFDTGGVDKGIGAVVVVGFDGGMGGAGDAFVGDIAGACALANATARNMPYNMQTHLLAIFILVRISKLCRWV
ncbi:glycine-rich protein DOT1-like [Chenopodium quinoa]|uniref:glycine-rich protein DOT1-like n=1 Tax=Chenopodium quinoa TaxID=63459 RepID=UPI000B774441|nr:glycine-rich protein DOT1-like [Chenopodium quinoa]